MQLSSSLTAVIFIFALSSQAQANDLETIRERFASHLISAIDTTHAAEHLDSQRDDGGWEDINYADRARAGWSPHQHVLRIRSIAAAYHQPKGPLHLSQEALAGVRRGLAYWQEVAPHSANPWTVRIGVPMIQGEILILMHGQIDPALRQQIVENMARLLVDEGRGGYARWGAGGTRRERGPDVVRSASIHISIGILNNDPGAIEIASRYIQAEAKIDNNSEGIQPDGSYQTHGPQIYYPGYWQEHIRQTALWAELLAGTPWAFKEDAQGFLRTATLDSAQWVIRRGHYDPFVMGRGIARKDGGRARLDWVKGLIEADPEHADQYRAFLDHVAGKNDGSLVGNRHFWLSDYMNHRRENFMIGLRMVSTRTARQEAGNEENVQNRFLSQGATSILVNGDEYQDLYPAWNWRRIPGVTAPHTAGGRGSMQAGNWGGRGTTDFVGGASDGKHGVATMDVDWYDGDPEGRGRPRHLRDPGRIYAHKNWFFFDREMVALGSGIRYNGQFAPVETTLNQTVRTTPIFSNLHPDASGEPETERRIDTKLQWLWHADVGYLFPTPQNVVIRNESQVTGSWRSIKRSYDTDDTVTKDRFTLGIDHGDKPDGETYAYIIVPGMSREDFDAYRKQNHVAILANTPDIAAVHHKSQRLTGIVFRDPANVNQLKINDKLTVEVDAPTILLVDESATPIRVTAGCPTANAVKVTLVTPEGEHVLDFELRGTRSVTLPQQ